MDLASLAPLHSGHEGSGFFDAYNLTVGGIVLVLLAAVGFALYKLIQRRRYD
jgi:drug/metabolite transporter (DMT)-like permease